jgi:hypothetical protein
MKAEPVKIRGVENLHILLWIAKDTCWLLEWRVIGVCMILPTISVAIYLTCKSGHQREEFIHNLAIVFWLFANSIWMIGEFFYDDGTRHYSLIFFIFGLITLATHYLPKWWRLFSSKTAR